MWETIFIFSRINGSKISDYFDDLYTAIMFAIIPIVMILLGIVEIIRLLDIKRQKRYHFSVKSVAMIFFLIIGVTSIPITITSLNETYEIITGTSELVKEEDDFYERIEKEDYDYVIEGYGEITYKEPSAKLFHVQIDGKEYVIKQYYDYGLFNIPENGKMKLFLIIREPNNEEDNIPEENEAYHDDIVVRLDVWKE